jgi:PAS domain S-box-containing protein
MENKTKGQLVAELAKLRQRIVELEAVEINRKQSDDSLLWNKGKLNNVLQSIGDHMSMMDKDLNIIWANKVAMDAFGNDIIGKRCYEVYHKRTEPCEPYPCLTLKAFQDGGGYEHDTQVIDKDGKIIYFHCTANVALKDEEGKPTAVIEISRDITERKETEELYRTLSEKTWTAVYVVQDGIIQLLNSRGAAYVGYTPEELIGKKSISIIHPEDREMAAKNSVAMLKGKLTSPYEFRVITKDGDIRWIIETTTPINYKGKRAILGNSIDITERKIIEKALQQSEQMYRTLIDSTFDLVFTVDSRQIFTHINPRFEEVTGYSLLDLKGQRFTYVLAPEYREQSVTRFKLGMKGEAIPPYEADLVHKHGRRIAVEFLVITLHDTTGQPTGRFGVGRDITQRKQADEELKRHREHLELINHILRHDVLNDLAAVKSALRLYGNSNDEKFLKEAPRYVDRGVETIRRMRELESLISSRKDLEFYDIKAVIKEITKNYSSTEFTIEGRGQVLADEALVSVIDNIISNAINHGKTDRIDITIDKHENFREVRIADYGIGIPDKMKEKIFEEGFRYGGTGHTGLGLYIVKKAMESYGGSAYVEDNNPTGAVFVLKLKRVR